jgi:ArsR family transcriptional regulator, arsenate/arsenite/antimonite-responsive transcriptional repressor
VSTELRRLQEQLAKVAARVAALEAAGGLPGGPAAPERRPGDPGAAAGEAGSVGYSGTVRLAGEVRWRIELDAAAVLELPAPAVVRVLAALGHAVRLSLVRRLLAGPATVAQLQEAVGGSSAGQVYHHLSTLTAAGVVETAGGGVHRIPPTGVVPVLVTVLAAADLGGVLR